MANPQLSNGYVRIANELLEAICRLNISGNEMRILLYIIRRTYGFNKSYAEIPLSEISTAVGMRREHIQKALKKLSGKNIIELHTYSGTKSQTISIVKDYQKWNVESVQVVCCQNRQLLQKLATLSVAENGNTTVAENGNSTYKDNIKDNKDRGKTARPHGRFGNVFLSDDEINKLNDDYGEEHIRDYVQRVDSHVQSTGKAYADYDATIRKWLEQDGVKKSDFDADKYSFAINNF
ncbi:MAG: replication protein [Ruminococcus sp.]|nr:replication protein [Ruminococcus sp.]